MSDLGIETWLEKTIGFENPKMGLSRITKAIKYFNLQTDAKVIIVAGTNGKGTTARAIASAIAKKHRVSLHTSPHIHSITERFFIDNQFICEDELFLFMKKSFEQLEENNLKLSHFEFLFFTFWKLCCETTLDYIVLEVGLGGRFDATNSVDSDLAIITSISRDHQEFLGTRYDQILFEKVGVSRKDVPLITSFQSEYLNDQMRNLHTKFEFDWMPIKYDASHTFVEYNESLALKALEFFQIAELPERNTSVIQVNSSDLYLFGSHNLDAIRKLVQYLKQKYYNNADNYFDLIILSFSKRSLVEIQQMITLFKCLNCEIIILGFDHFKALDHNSLKNIAKENGLDFATKADYKIPTAKKILVSGSNYFIGKFSNTYT